MTSLFAPSTITLSTLSKLLALYPTTAENVYRAKLLAKSSRKSSKAVTSRGKSQKTAETAELDQGIEKDVEEFVELDTWRFETLPRILRERLGLEAGFERESDDERPAKRAKKGHDTKAQKVNAGKGTRAEFFLSSDEIVRLMDWKLKHGTFRPALLGRIQSNTEATVKSSTRTAFNAIPSPSSDDPFPAESLQTLSDSLSGVGPATASLILSVMPASSDKGNNIPFFSDELVVWLCLGVCPDSKSVPLNHSSSFFRAAKRGIKYNVKEYRQLHEAVGEFRARIQSACDADGKSVGLEKGFSTLDVEKIAFVIGHLEVSGWEGTGQGEDQDVEGNRQLKNSENAGGASRSEEKGVVEENEGENEGNGRRTRSGTKRQLK